MLVPLLAACSRSRSFKLPDMPDGDLAFGVLYRGEQVAAVGPVVLRAALNAGYAIENDSSDLLARLFLIKDSELIAAAEMSCAMLESPVERVACAQVVESCRG